MCAVHLNVHPERTGSQDSVGCNRGEFPGDRSGYRWIFQRRQFPCFGTVFMSHLAGVFEEGGIVGGGFDAQHLANLVVNFDGGAAHAVFYTGAFEAGREPIQST